MSLYLVLLRFTGVRFMISALDIIGSIGYIICIVIIYRLVFIPPEGCPDWQVGKRNKIIAIGYISLFTLCLVLMWVY